MSDTRFRLFTANSLKSLASRYCKDRQANPTCYRLDGGDGVPDLFFRERIGVASRGMGIWLKQCLVSGGRVLVNVECPMLREIIDGVLDAFMSGTPGYAPALFKDTVLVWRIYGLLKTFDSPVISAYLGNDQAGSPEQDVRRYQLARKLSQLYFDYMALVPELLHPEEVGKDELPANDPRHWQLDLWRLLCKDDGGNPLISPAQAMLRFLSAERLSPDDYAPVTFFGVSAMPAYYLRVLKKLASVQNVNFFYLNHCDELWDDVKAGWETLRDKTHFEQLEDSLNAQYDNTLLGNFGQQGREFFKAVMDLDNDIEEHSWDDDSGPDDADADDNGQPPSLLQAIQRSIRHNVNGADGFSLHLPRKQDDSLTVHSCFSDMREVEALHDSLLRLLTEYADGGSSGRASSHLAFNDIIVMAPDISRFAPMIRSVFDRGPLKHSYSICDRSLRETNLTAEAFLAILELDNCQFALSRLNKLLDCTALRNRFGLSEEDVQTAREWFVQAGIRWGKDGSSRDGAALDEHYSWQYGLDRLLLKLAFDGKDASGQERTGYAGLAPADIATGKDQMLLLGSLHRLYREICDFMDAMKATGRTAAEWCDLLLEKRGVFFLPDGDCAAEYAALGSAICDLRQSLEAAGRADDVMPYSVVLAAIASELDMSASSDAFLSGRITFCSLLPMRGIPCKVIAMLGMDSGEFPRPNDETSFTLINRKDGNLLKYYDRSRSVEDRFTFLEALMSAEDYLMLFYRGRDDKTLNPLNAAAPVVELLAYTSRLTADWPDDDWPDTDWSSEKTAKVWPLVEHRLNGFDGKSFHHLQACTPHTGMGKPHTGALLKLFSFDKDMASVANLPRKIDQDRPPLWQSLLASADATPIVNAGDTLTIDLRDVIDFLRDPVDAFAVNCLKLHKEPWEEEHIGDYEPFALNALNASILKRTLAQNGVQAEDYAEYATCNKALQTLAKAQCKLPLGSMGDIEIKKSLADSWIIDENFRNLYGDQERSPLREHNLELDVDIPTAAWAAGLWDTARPDGDNAAGTVHVILKGKFKSVPGGGVCACSFSASRSSRAVIEGYLRHLVLCAASDGDSRLESHFLLKNANGEQDDLLVYNGDARSQLAFILKLYLAGKRWLLPLFGNVSVQLAQGETPADAFKKDLSRLNTSLIFNDWESWSDAEQACYPLHAETVEEASEESDTADIAETDGGDDAPEELRACPIQELAQKCYAGLKLAKREE